jgi:hypothetical protein
MNQLMHSKIFLLWLPMIAIAFINATLRELVLIKHFNELYAHQLSTITLIIFCSVYVYAIFPYLTIQSVNESLWTGFLWVILTVAFEFFLGRLTHKTWHFLLQDYNLLAGRIWLLFLTCLFLLPYVLFHFRK